MYYLKTKYFARWARKEKIADTQLWETIAEFEKGLFGANLGNYLFKKRLALGGRGKSGGGRIILFYQKGEKLIFCSGFSKNQHNNLSYLDFKLLNKLSETLKTFSENTILNNIQHGEFIVIEKGEIYEK